MSLDTSLQQVNVVKLTLHNRLVGYLMGAKNGTNVLTFADEFKYDSSRPTFSLITHPNFPNSDKILTKPWARKQRLHPSLSNLLPEGALRELISQGLKSHINDEFPLLCYLGLDLPGALVVSPIAVEDIPDDIKIHHNITQTLPVSMYPLSQKFSLAGVQMKFSMHHLDGRYCLSNTNELGDWIIKTPSTLHKFVPLNEFTAMSLAAIAGINIPEIKLIELSKLDNLPSINLPQEQMAYAIKRFDRHKKSRIHSEDFAQVLLQYPENKYESANYEQIARIIYHFSGDGLADVQQFARRLLVNILLANGDAHLKNWSLIYPDKITARLSPAYDILCTSVYINGESEFALNLAKTKQWYTVTLQHFNYWCKKSGIPWRVILPHIQDCMQKARTLWPQALKDLPMHEQHKLSLKKHWLRLHTDFQIKA